MDQRLKFLPGMHRPHRLTRNETPDLARAIVGFLRGQVACERGISGGVGYVWLHGDSGHNITVRYDDWVKIVPYLKDGSFDPTLVPVPGSVVLDPLVKFDGSVVGLADQELYGRIKTVLDQLFPVEFPTR